ncbi:hypothetical protein N6H18_17335 [Reichenbachiella agarivorans]|uniref:Outer membrane protein beta-barrel domain-containing protein n=1 Tax=Reichenbachiella agarivorans TaxID=2979464 RepID=A0ABY6CNK5_9BACT|nr:hypothetical protein [Reichenbachiella agarivorans]UXP32109.1 hypothetical protein N6H18_17335 [Reichenbachiella agarivorans]
MKQILKLAITIILFILVAQCSRAQSLRVSATIEKAVMGVQTGTEVSYRFKNKMGIGGFYQKNLPNLNETSNSEYEFTGIAVSVPITQCNKIMLSGVLRAGVINRRFVIVTPSVETEVKVSKHLSFALGLGIRATEAAINTKFSWTL